MPHRARWPGRIEAAPTCGSSTPGKGSLRKGFLRLRSPVSFFFVFFFVVVFLNSLIVLVGGNKEDDT